MKATDHNKLDNPVWYSLSEYHKHFGVDFNNIKFYHPDYCPFGGFKDVENISEHIEEYSSMVADFFIVGEKPEFPNHLKLKNELKCLQMVVSNRIDIKINDGITKLNTGHTDLLYQLVNLVQPGYFKKKTPLLGDYFGILENDKLIAVTGERMKMNDYVEVSAVVTHPNHTGKGYAKQLVTHTVNNILNQNKTPYLHVAENNIGAIKLYEKLGFKLRRQISFWNITK